MPRSARSPSRRPHERHPRGRAGHQIGIAETSPRARADPGAAFAELGGICAAFQCRIGDLVQDRQLAGAYVGFAKAILGDHSLGMQGRGRIDPELADWRAGRDAIYQLAALTVGARLAVADG